MRREIPFLTRSQIEESQDGPESGEWGRWNPLSQLFTFVFESFSFVLWRDIKILWYLFNALPQDFFKWVGNEKERKILIFSVLAVPKDEKRKPTNHKKQTNKMGGKFMCLAFYFVSGVAKWWIFHYMNSLSIGNVKNLITVRRAVRWCQKWNLNIVFYIFVSKFFVAELCNPDFVSRWINMLVWLLFRFWTLITVSFHDVFSRFLL